MGKKQQCQKQSDYEIEKNFYIYTYKHNNKLIDEQEANENNHKKKSSSI
jgi:hypothetical protein